MHHPITIHIEEEAESAEHMAVILERIAQRLRKGDTRVAITEKDKIYNDTQFVSDGMFRFDA